MPSLAVSWSVPVSSWRQSLRAVGGSRVAKRIACERRSATGRYAARHRVPVPSLARWLLALGIAATLTANMAQGWSHGPVGAVVAAWPAAAPSYLASRSQTAPGPGSPSGRPTGTSTARAPATSLQHARPPAPRTSQVFAGDQPTPAPAADPFSLADPATAGAILATSGFTAVKITGVHEPVYYGPDAASALRGMLSLQMTKALLAPLDAASTRHALSQLRAALANHRGSGGVFFDSYTWLITVRRPETLTPQLASSTRTPPPCRPARPARHMTAGSMAGTYRTRYGRRWPAGRRRLGPGEPRFICRLSAARMTWRRRSSTMVRAAIPEPRSSSWPTPGDRAGGHRRPVLPPVHGALPGPGLRAWCCH